MRVTILLLVLAFITFACSNKEKSVQSSADSTSTSLNMVAPPSLDSAIFIAEAAQFTDSKDVYTPLHLQRGKSSTEAFEKLDTLNVKNDGNVRRKSLSLAHAGNYFYLKGLDTVLLFDRSHQFVGKSFLKSVDYVDDSVESQFVAVYDLPKGADIAKGFAYCVSNQFPIKRVDNFEAQEINDTELNKKIAKVLKLGKADGWVMHHIKTMPSGNIYSIASKDTRSLIAETTSSGTTVLKEVNNEYHFGNMVPLPLHSNGKPLMLISYFFPETDGGGNFTAAFNGTAYHEVQYSRVPLKQLEP
jgi:hypothetical protein